MGTSFHENDNVNHVMRDKYAHMPKDQLAKELLEKETDAFMIAQQSGIQLNLRVQYIGTTTTDLTSGTNYYVFGVEDRGYYVLDNNNHARLLWKEDCTAGDF